MKNSSAGAASGVIVAAVAALLVGGIGGYAISSANGNSSQNNSASNSATTASTDTKAADLRTLLNNLQTEHVSLASDATRAGFDGDPSFPAAAAALGQNTDEISAAVGSVYGEEAGAQFKEIWASHIGFFVDYTVAAKAGDTAGMEKAVTNLNGYVDAISTFFSDANPNLPKETVAMVVGEHVTLLKGAVDAHGAGDYAQSFEKQREADKQIRTIADTVSGAIVKQKPENFR